MKQSDVIKREVSKVLGRVTTRVNRFTPFMSDDDVQTTQKCYALTKSLFRSDWSKEDKNSIAEVLVRDFKISTNVGGTKYYVGVLGKNRKIFGDASKSSEMLVKKLQEYTSLDTVDFSLIKKSITSSAKPDLGKEHEVTPNKSEYVRAMFYDDVILSRLHPNMYGIFAPSKDGEYLFPSNQYPIEYLKQSFDSPALNKTITVVEFYVKKGQIDTSYLIALINHKGRLSTILDKYTTICPDMANEIDESYNKLMIDLHTSDPGMASAVLKQFAENRLYEVNLANGNEVYLPSKGTFPAGDIIKRTNGKQEMVSLVSCKYGKTGRIYGCPANMKSITSLHPDEACRNLFGQYVGEDGHILMVRDDLFHNEDGSLTRLNLFELVQKSLVKQGLRGLFNEDDLVIISNLLRNYFYTLRRIKEDIKTKHEKILKPIFWSIFQQELKLIKDRYTEQLREIATKEKMAQIVGENNASTFTTRLTPDVFLSTVLLCENIRSGGGYGLEHNKQYYDEFNQPKFVTEAGNDNPNDYVLAIRNERTLGRSGGGIQLSYSGDGEK